MTTPDLAAIDRAIVSEQVYLGLTGKAHQCLMLAQSECYDKVLARSICRLAELVKANEINLLYLGAERDKVTNEGAKALADYGARKASRDGKGASHASA